MVEFIVALLVIILIIDLPLILWWQNRQRDCERKKLHPAYERAEKLVRRALEAYRSSEAYRAAVMGAKPLDRQGPRILALMAAVGDSEEEARALVARATQRSESEAALQDLLAHAAEQQERDLSLDGDKELLMKNIAEARETVMRLVPIEM